MDKVDVFAKKSIMNSDIDREIKGIHDELVIVENEVTEKETKLSNLRTPEDVIRSLIDLESKLPSLNNKHRKKCERDITSIKESNKFIAQDRKMIDDLNILTEKRASIQRQLISTETFITGSSDKVVHILKKNEFMDDGGEITMHGKIASQIKELHSLAFVDVLDKFQYFKEYTYQEIVGILSCFTNINVKDDYKSFTVETDNMLVKSAVTFLNNRLDHYYDQEVEQQISTGSEYTIHYDLIEYMMSWCESSNEPESKLVIQKLQADKNVFLGEFIKAILKVNNIVTELEKIANFVENIELLSKLNEIKNNTLKFVATTQSLYV